MASSESRKPKKKSGKDAGLPAELRELVDLIVTYAKQETLDPLKQLGRWVAYGIAGALLVGLGFLLVGLGLLRAIQSEAGKHLAGDWSWVPYVIVVIFLGGVIALMVSRMSHGPGRPQRPTTEPGRPQRPLTGPGRPQRQSIPGSEER